MNSPASLTGMASPGMPTATAQGMAGIGMPSARPVPTPPVVQPSAGAVPDATARAVPGATASDVPVSVAGPDRRGLVRGGEVFTNTPTRSRSVAVGGNFVGPSGYYSPGREGAMNFHDTGGANQFDAQGNWIGPSVQRALWPQPQQDKMSAGVTPRGRQINPAPAPAVREPVARTGAGNITPSMLVRRAAARR